MLFVSSFQSGKKLPRRCHVISFVNIPWHSFHLTIYSMELKPSYHPHHLPYCSLTYHASSNTYARTQHSPSYTPISSPSWYLTLCALHMSVQLKSLYQVLTCKYYYPYLVITVANNSGKNLLTRASSSTHGWQTCTGTPTHAPWPCDTGAAIMWGRCSNHQGAVTHTWDKLYPGWTFTD